MSLFCVTASRRVTGSASSPLPSSPNPSTPAFSALSRSAAAFCSFSKRASSPRSNFSASYLSRENLAGFGSESMSMVRRFTGAFEPFMALFTRRMSSSSSATRINLACSTLRTMDPICRGRVADLRCLGGEVGAKSSS